MPTILITGASRGLGLEFVRQYAADGWDVVAACRNPAKAEALQKLAAAHKSIRVEILDVLDPASIKALAAALKDTALDVLINNAGIYSGDGSKDKGQSFGAIDAAGWDKVLRTNTIAPIMVTEALMPSILKGQMRKIAMITSRMGSIAESNPGAIAYRSSKAALNAAMHNIALSLAGQVKTVSLHPGWVKTDMGGAGAEIAPEVSIKGLRRMIEKLDDKMSGGFFAYDGREIPW